MSDRSFQRRRRTAYHEAGHALAAWKLKIPFKRVSVVAADKTWHVLYPALLSGSDWDSIPPRARDRLERRMIVGLAGGEAERLISGRYNHRGARSDYRNVWDIVSRLAGSIEEASAYSMWLSLRARNLIRAPQHRPSLDALAAALMAQSKIDGVAAVTIMRDALLAATRAQSMSPLEGNGEVEEARR